MGAKQKPNRQSTRHVMLNLQKGIGRTYEPVGLKFSTDTQEQYVKEATAWLCDRSELSRQTIETADWDEIYAFFKTYDGSL